VNVRQLLARTPEQLEAEKRQAEKTALLRELGPVPRHGRIARRPAWLLAFLERKNPQPKRIRPPELSGRARHLAYRAAKRRAAERKAVTR
jgi:hypothetical protein